MIRKWLRRLASVAGKLLKILNFLFVALGFMTAPLWAFIPLVALLTLESIFRHMGDIPTSMLANMVAFPFVIACIFLGNILYLAAGISCGFMSHFCEIVARRLGKLPRPKILVEFGQVPINQSVGVLVT